MHEHISSRRAIPAVSKILEALEGNLDLPRTVVVAIIRQELAALRKSQAVPNFCDVVAQVRGVALIRSKPGPSISSSIVFPIARHSGTAA